jgi:uncharacterized membrane protein YvlD (DUF360 family)
MTLLLRIILTALWLIFTNLLLSGFQPGGRYLILLEAIVIGAITHLVRLFISKRMNPRAIRFMSAAGLIPGLFLVRFVFTGIKLSVLGVLVAYLGMIMIESIIPGIDTAQSEPI